MEEKLIRRVPVVDDAGSCVGIIALADIALHTGKNVAGHIVKGSVGTELVGFGCCALAVLDKNIIERTMTHRE